MKRGLVFTWLLFITVAFGITINPWFASAAEPPKDPKTIKIGFISSITGPVSFIHENYVKAIGVAVKEINEAGGIAGVPVEIVYEDNKSGDPRAALSAMNKLISIDKIQVTGVNFTAAILAAQPLAAEHKVLQFNTGGWSPTLINKPYLFSIKITGGGMVQSIAKAAFDKGSRRAAILGPNDAAGTQLAKDAETLWTKWGGKVVAKETAPMGQTDFQVNLAKIKNANPDVVFVFFYGVDSGYAIKQARELGLKVPIYGMLWSNEAYKASGPAAAGFVFVDDYWDPEKGGPWAKRMVDGYFKLYGTREIQPFAVNAYTMVYLVKDLTEEARKMGGDYFKGEILKDILLKKRRFKSVFGPDLIFRDDGSCVKPMGLYEVQADGKKKLLEVITPKE